MWLGLWLWLGWGGGQRGRPGGREPGSSQGTGAALLVPTARWRALVMLPCRLRTYKLIVRSQTWKVLVT